MTNIKYQSYEQAAAAYMAEFDALMRAPARTKTPGVAPARPASPRTIIGRAAAIAEISAAMIPMAKDRMADQDHAVREGISAQLAAQAGAEFQLAIQLLDIVEQESQAPASARRHKAGPSMAASTAAGPTIEEPSTEGPNAAEEETDVDEDKFPRENPSNVGSDEAGPTADGPGIAIAVAEDAGPSMRAQGMAGPTSSEPSMSASVSAMRAAGLTALQDAVRSLHRTMDAPPARALAAAAPAPRRDTLPTDIEAAKAALREAAVGGVTAISDGARELSAAVAVDLITNTEWRAVVSGASMLNKDVAVKIESVKKGVGAILERAVATAARTLLNVYDKLLALLGKDTEDAARRKVQGWVAEIRQEQKVDLLGKLMAQLYRLDEFQGVLDEWLAKAPADVDKVNAATTAVQEVAPRFGTFTSYLKTVEDGVVLAKRFIKLPQVLAVGAGLQVLLMAVVVYTGYDYIGYRELRFPNLARGVAQVVQENLGVQG